MTMQNSPVQQACGRAPAGKTESREWYHSSDISH